MPSTVAGQFRTLTGFPFGFNERLSEHSVGRRGDSESRTAVAMSDEPVVAIADVRVEPLHRVNPADLGQRQPGGCRPISTEYSFGICPVTGHRSRSRHLRSTSFINMRGLPP